MDAGWERGVVGYSYGARAYWGLLATVIILLLNPAH
jgi:hypothetical protein